MAVKQVDAESHFTDDSFNQLIASGCSSIPLKYKLYIFLPTTPLNMTKCQLASGPLRGAICATTKITGLCEREQGARKWTFFSQNEPRVPTLFNMDGQFYLSFVAFPVSMRFFNSG